MQSVNPGGKKTYGFCCGGLLLRRCIGIKLIGRNTGLSGLLDEGLLDGFRVEVRLGVLGSLLGYLNGPLLPQFTLLGLYVLRRHGSVVGGGEPRVKNHLLQVPNRYNLDSPVNGIFFFPLLFLRGEGRGRGDIRGKNKECEMERRKGLKVRRGKNVDKEQELREGTIHANEWVVGALVLGIGMVALPWELGRPPQRGGEVADGRWLMAEAPRQLRES